MSKCVECDKNLTKSEQRNTEFGCYCEECYKACVVNTVDLEPDQGGQDGRGIAWDELS